MISIVIYLIVVKTFHTIIYTIVVEFEEKYGKKSFNLTIWQLCLKKIIIN